MANELYEDGFPETYVSPADRAEMHRELFLADLEFLDDEGLMAVINKANGLLHRSHPEAVAQLEPEAVPF